MSLILANEHGSDWFSDEGCHHLAPQTHHQFLSKLTWWYDFLTYVCRFFLKPSTVAQIIFLVSFCWIERRMRMKGFPVKLKMTRDNWNLKPRRWEVTWKLQTGINLLLESRVYLDLILLFLCRSVRSAEAKGYADHVSVGGEGASLQGHVGGFKFNGGGLPVSGALLQISL